MATANRIIKNTAFLYIKMGITMFISLYTTRIILNSLGASDFGIFNIVGTAIAMLGFLNTALSSSTQRFMNYAEGEGSIQNKKKIFNASIALHFIISIIVFIILEILSVFFFNYILSIPDDRIFSAKVIYHCAVIATVFSIQSVPYDAVMNAHENMLYYAIIGIFESVLKLIVAIIIVYVSSDKLILYGILMALISLIICVILRFYCHYKYEECQFNIRKYFDIHISKQIISFAGWNATSTITTLLSQYGLGIVLNHFFGTIVNAAQGITNQLSGQLGALSTNAVKAINPVIAKSAGAKDYDFMYKSSIWGSKILFFLTSVCFLPVLLNLNSILAIWLKDIPAYTQIFIYLYFIVNLIDTISICLPVAIAGIGKIKGYQLSLSIINIIPLVGCIILFQKGYEPYYAYCIMIIASFFKLLSRLYYAHVKCNFPLRDMIKNEVIPAVSTFICVFLVLSYIKKHLVIDNNYVSLFGFVIFDVIIYSVVYYFTCFKKDEQKYIIQIIKQIAYKIKKR